MNQSNMLKSFLLHFIFLILTIDVRAQQSPQDSNNFQPSVALVIGLLSIIFLLTFLLLLYAKFCHRGPLVHNASLRIRDGLFRSRSVESGIDKEVINSLPFFRFSSLKGSRDGLECSVCLAKFQDFEILRLLPKCKHAFHIDCIDQWLEKHSTCPLCRRKISPGDVSEFPFSDSLRFLRRSQSGDVIRDESDIELYVQREETGIGSSRFSIGRGFKLLNFDSGRFKKRFDRFNHRVVGGSSEAVFKNRWSNVSSSDLVFLNSELLNDASSARFMCKKSMGVDTTTSDSTKKMEFGSNFPHPIGKRSMSEIVVHPRFREFEGNTDPSVVEKNVESERMRRIWIQIARKTVQWFANREQTRPPNSQGLINL